MKKLTPQQRLSLIKCVSSLPSPAFRAFVFTFKPPSGIIPNSSAPIGEGAVALIEWLESHSGQPLLEVLKRLSELTQLPPQLACFIQPRYKNINGRYELDIVLSRNILLKMIYIPSGIFCMGSPDNELGRQDQEGPILEVKVPSFYLGKYPVTQAQWESLEVINPSQFKGAKRPVERVTWSQADHFCKQLSQHIGQTCRLPSESEWEYACRAGTNCPYWTGGEITRKQAKFGSIFNRSTVPVGRYDRNLFGLYDMHGNVWEWCQDMPNRYGEHTPVDGSAYELGGYKERRIIRGGSWKDSKQLCRSACRLSVHQKRHTSDLGFRVALTLQ